MGGRGLASLAAAGAVAVTMAMATTGVLAVFTDTAETGAGGGGSRDRVTSAARAREAAIEIAPYNVSGQTRTCGTFGADLTTGIVAADNVLPSTTFRPSATVLGLCVRNVGAQQVSGGNLVVFPVDIAEDEVACTGSENEVDTDANCGTTGELGARIEYQFRITACGQDVALAAADITRPLITGTPLALSDGSGPLGGLAVNETECYAVWLEHIGGPTTDLVRSQSDRVRWRFRVQATVN